MRRDMIEVLTVIPQDEIGTVGLQFLQNELQVTEEERHKLEIFWDYFRRTWMSKFSPNDWNLSRILDSTELLANRTNNPLENYNRRLNELFPHPHPNLKDFVFKLRLETERRFQEYQNCQSGVSQPPAHAAMTTADDLVIPSTYRSFRATFLNETQSETEFFFNEASGKSTNQRHNC